MTDHTIDPLEADRLWALLTKVPELFPHARWYIFSDDLMIQITARRDGWKVGYGWSYYEIAGYVGFESIMYDAIRYMDRNLAQRVST